MKKLCKIIRIFSRHKVHTRIRLISLRVKLKIVYLSHLFVLKENQKIILLRKIYNYSYANLNKMIETADFYLYFRQHFKSSIYKSNITILYFHIYYSKKKYLKTNFIQISSILCLTQIFGITCSLTNKNYFNRNSKNSLLIFLAYKS